MSQLRTADPPRMHMSRIQRAGCISSMDSVRATKIISEQVRGWVVLLVMTECS